MRRVATAATTAAAVVGGLGALAADAGAQALPTPVVPAAGVATTPAPVPAPAPAATTTDEAPSVVTTPHGPGHPRVRTTTMPVHPHGELIQRRRTAAERAAAERRAARAAAAARAREAAPTTAPAAPPAAAAAGLAPGAEGDALALPQGASLRVRRLLLGSFRIPPFLLPIYQAAGVQYGVRWEVLAAINEVETDYGRNVAVSSAGAQGWMQFMPSTWARWGVDADRDGHRDPYAPTDAIFAAARYLHAAGYAADPRRAIFAYNHADWYVDGVLARARLLSALPTGVVDALTTLSAGRFPVDAEAHYRAPDAPPADADHVDVRAAAGSRVVAVQDGQVVRVGRTRPLGRYVVLRDLAGNRYTYAQLGALRGAGAPTAPAPREDGSPAQAGVLRRPERLAALPERPATKAAARAAAATGAADATYVPTGGGADASPSRLRTLRPGARVLAGMTLGRLARDGRGDGTTGHVRLLLRPAGRSAPQIDPRPILDGWRLLAAATRDHPLAGRSVGRVLLEPKAALERRVLTAKGIRIYACGREDVRAGRIDRRVLATLAYLDVRGLHPTVSALECGHGRLTSSGNVSEHSTGSAVDIAAINGVPVLGHQGPGTDADRVVRELLALQGAMRPHQVISLMTYPGQDVAFALPDHADHVHVGFRADGSGGRGRAPGAGLGPRTWTRLVRRLSATAAPRVPTEPSPTALADRRPEEGR